MVGMTTGETENVDLAALTSPTVPVAVNVTGASMLPLYSASTRSVFAPGRLPSVQGTSA